MEHEQAGRKRKPRFIVQEQEALGTSASSNSSPMLVKMTLRPRERTMAKRQSKSMRASDKLKTDKLKPQKRVRKVQKCCEELCTKSQKSQEALLPNKDPDLTPTERTSADIKKIGVNPKVMLSTVRKKLKLANVLTYQRKHKQKEAD